MTRRTPARSHAETVESILQHGSRTFACPRLRRPVPAFVLRVTLFLLAYLLILLVASLPKGLAPPPLADVVWGGVASFALLALTHWVLAREGRAWRDVGLGVDRGTLPRVVAVRSGGLAMPIGVHAGRNVAQWMVGAKDSPGISTLDVDPAHTVRMTTFAPYVGLAVTVLAAPLIARRPTRHGPAAGG